MKINPFKNYLARLKEISLLLNLSPAEQKRLAAPDRIIQKNLAVRIKGRLKTFKAYRVQWNKARGPYKGGVRFHPAADLDKVKTLAALMALKCAAVGLPLGGGKGGVAFDPKEFGKKEIEQIARAWARAMHPFIGADKDIPAPDVYTNAEIMGLMLDEFEKIIGRSQPAAFTGKPLSLGGSLGRDTATAQGGVFVLQELLKKLRPAKPTKATRVVVQGFGNAGFEVARLLFQSGCKIVGVSDSRGGIVSQRGFDPIRINKLKEEKKPVNAMYCEDSVCDQKKLARDEAKVVSNEELLETDCDILIPAALDNQITEKNASKIKARVILELANNPTTPEADRILEKRGIIVAPDILANAGGVTVSYFEWVQSLQNFYWNAEKVRAELKSVMTRAFAEIWKISRERKLSLRQAAYFLAVGRLAEAIRDRGI